MLQIFPFETSKDIEIVKRLFGEYADFLKEQLCEYRLLPWLVQYWQDYEKEVNSLPAEYAEPKGCLLIAKYNEQVAGGVAIRERSDGVCEMKRLYIRGKYRRLKIGRTLAEAVIEQGRKRGYRRMRLNTVLEPAKKLYKSLGFQEIKAYEYIPIEGIVYMELELL